MLGYSIARYIPQRGAEVAVVGSMWLNQPRSAAPDREISTFPTASLAVRSIHRLLAIPLFRIDASKYVSCVAFNEKERIYRCC